jgi:hypothetical protein
MDIVDEVVQAPVADPAALEPGLGHVSGDEAIAVVPE